MSALFSSKILTNN